MSAAPYQVVFLSGVLLGAALESLRELGWAVEAPDHEGFEVVTPSGMRLRVRVEKIESPKPLTMETHDGFKGSD